MSDVESELPTTTTCETAVITRHEQGYVIIDQTPGALQTWDTASEMMHAVATLVPETERAAIVVITNQSRTTRDARRAFSEVGGQVLSCVALVIDSRISEITGNFFLRLNSPPYPSRLFRDETAAREWATQFVGVPR